MCPGCGQARLDVVKRFVFICMCLVPFQWGSPAPAQTGGEAGEDCDPHGLEPGPVKERIQRWSGLKPFSNWRIRATDLAACARDGVVLLHLQIAPPAKWSVHDLPYRVWLTIPLDGASGQPMEAPPEAFASLAAGVKRMTARAERYEDVRRFIERFGVGRAEIDKTAETGCFRVTYVAEVQPGQKGPSGLVHLALPTASSMRLTVQVISILASRIFSCSPQKEAQHVKSPAAISTTGEA